MVYVCLASYVRTSVHICFISTPEALGLVNNWFSLGGTRLVREEPALYHYIVNTLLNP